MFDFDGDGDINEFDEELTEYELQFIEDEMLFEKDERRQIHGAGKEEDWGNSCGYGVLIAIGLIVLVLIILELT